MDNKYIEWLAKYHIPTYFEIIQKPGGLICYICMRCTNNILSHNVSIFNDNAFYIALDREHIRNHIIDQLQYHHYSHHYVPPVVDVR